MAHTRSSADCTRYNAIYYWKQTMGVWYWLHILMRLWWRHEMEAFSALLALCEGKPPVTGVFPSQRLVTRGFDIFFDLCLNKRLSKRSRWRWLETPSGSLWRHCNGVQCNYTHDGVGGGRWAILRDRAISNLLRFWNRGLNHCKEHN